MKNLTHNFDSKIKYQKYSYYLLPITIEPLKYGNLIEQIGNKYIIQMNTLNVLVINSVDNDNFIRFYNKGNFLFEFKDSKVTNEKFTRIIQDQKFTFEKGKLITTELLTPNSSIIIYSNSDVLLTDNNPLLKNDDYIPILSFLLKKIKDPVKAFLLWEFCLILFFYIIFGILPDLFINNELEIITLSTVNIIKLRSVSAKNKWEDLEYKVNNHNFSNVLFKTLLNRFWSRIENQFNENNHMFILFKIKYITG